MAPAIFDAAVVLCCRIAIVTTNLSVDDAQARLRAEHPTGYESTWHCVGVTPDHEFLGLNHLTFVYDADVR